MRNTTWVPRVLRGPRNVITQTFNAEAQVWRKASISDGEGGTTDTFTQVAAYRCLLSRSAVRPQEREATVILEGIQQWTFTFEYGTDILRTDRIVFDGRTFEVIGVGSGSYELAHRVLCLEIT